MSGRWFTPDWRESDVSVAIMQEMRKHTAERRRTLSHGAESRAARGEEVSWARDSQDKQRDITFNAKHYFYHLHTSLETGEGCWTSGGGWKLRCDYSSQQPSESNFFFKKWHFSISPEPNPFCFLLSGTLLDLGRGFWPGLDNFKKISLPMNHNFFVSSSLSVWARPEKLDSSVHVQSYLFSFLLK